MPETLGMTDHLKFVDRESLTYLYIKIIAVTLIVAGGLSIVAMRVIGSALPESSVQTTEERPVFFAGARISEVLLFTTDATRGLTVQDSLLWLQDRYDLPNQELNLLAGQKLLFWGAPTGQSGDGLKAHGSTEYRPFIVHLPVERLLDLGPADVDQLSDITEVPMGISPNGKYGVLQSQIYDQQAEKYFQHLRVVLLDREQGYPTVDERDIFGLDEFYFAPNEAFIAINGSDIPTKIVNLADGSERNVELVTQAGYQRVTVPSPDGQQIYYLRQGSDVWVKDLQTNSERFVTQISGNRFELTPDGKILVYFTAGSGRTLVAQSIHTGEQKVIAQGVENFKLHQNSIAVYFQQPQQKVGQQPPQVIDVERLFE